MDHKPPLQTGQVLETALELWRSARTEHALPIVGNSMLPLIRSGDEVVVAHGVDGVRRGDIVLFRRAGELIAHRVLSIAAKPEGRTFLTKGDNVLRPDGLVYAGEILGRVTDVRRGGRTLSLASPGWRLLAWFIAWPMWAWSQLVGMIPSPSKKLSPSSNGTARIGLARGLRFGFRIALKILQLPVARWRG